MAVLARDGFHSVGKNNGEVEDNGHHHLTFVVNSALPHSIRAIHILAARLAFCLGP